MREILFRGKHTRTGKWHYGLLSKDLYSGREYWSVFEINDIHYVWNNSVDDLLERYSVFPETIGQYTGLKDKNGTKIFEGDIVRTVYNGVEKVFVVVWDEDELDFKATNGKKNYGQNGFQYMPCCDEVEIIGNIYDNPELLEDIGNEN